MAPITKKKTTTSSALSALGKTNDALKEIRARLRPFLDILEEESDEEILSYTKPPHGGGCHDKDGAKTKQHVHRRQRRKAMARAAVALSLGTMRYMGHRLRGQDRGRKPGDPLRHELEHMRKVLVRLQGQDKQKKAAPTKTASTHKDAPPEAQQGLKRPASGNFAKSGERKLQSKPKSDTT